MIQSNKHGMITKSGNTYFSEDGLTNKSGNTLFHPDGSMSNRSGENMILGPHGMITVSGNMLFTPNGTFTLTGTMLIGPDGETWYGVNSMDEVKDIVAMACARKPKETVKKSSGSEITAEDLKNIKQESLAAIALTGVIVDVIIAVVWWIVH